MKAWLMVVAAFAAVACGSKDVSHGPVTIPRQPDVPDEPARPPEPTEVKEVWWGTIVLPNDLVDVVVTFERENDTEEAPVTATFAVPAVKVEGVELAEVVLAPEAIRFTLVKPAPRPPEHYDLIREPDGDEAEGTVTMAGASFFIRMVRQEPGAEPRVPITRPQTPRPPFPYTVREASIAAPADGTLAGSLTIPAGTGPFPAVLLISGSGLQDRDQTVFGHRTFLVLADHLTRAGFAVLRVDDRGAGGSKGKLGTLETDIGDARASFEWLMKQPEVDGKRVGLIGHSVGGVVAPIIATRTGKVAFIVTLGGPGLPGWELIPLQLVAQLDSVGIKPEVATRLAAGQRAVGKAVVSGKPAAVKAALRASFIAAAAATGGAAPTDEQLDAAVAAKMPEVEDPWTVSFFKEDPRLAWRKVTCPVLALWGEKDLQVPAVANLTAMKGALLKGRSKDQTLTILPGLNHLFQHAPKGTVGEYARLEETFDLDALRAIESWMSERAAKK